MKNLIAASTLLLLFTSANGNPPPARPSAPAVAVAGAPGTTLTPAQTVERYVDRVEDTSFRGCDRSASVLDGTDNTGGGVAAGGALRRGGPVGGQR